MYQYPYYFPAYPYGFLNQAYLVKLAEEAAKKTQTAEQKNEAPTPPPQEVQKAVQQHLAETSTVPISAYLPFVGGGAGLGALAGGVYALSSKERRKAWIKNLLLHMSLGALMGGAGGFGVGSIYNYLFPPNR